jgi:prepilin-type N-terminal cleavage/methylation domain-containing protein
VSTRRAGFTLLEMVLASVVGSMILLACFSLFVSMGRVEKSMNRASRQMEELALTQQILRKSFMTMTLLGTQALDNAMSEVAVDGVIPEEARPTLPRPRLIIEFDESPSIGGMITAAVLDGVTLADPGGFGIGPQRIEIVLPDKPVPESMRLFPRQWVSGPGDDLVAAFDPSGIGRPENESGVRGVFELRPDGARERVIEGYGITPATGLEPRPVTPAARTAPEGWTLWWRPVYGAEYDARQYQQPYDIDLTPAMLEEAVPLVRGIKTMRVYAFAAEENPDDPDAALDVQRWPQYEATTTGELPGYVGLEIETTSGMYADWVFEMGWSLAEETTAAAPADGTGDPNADGPDGQNPDGATPNGAPAGGDGATPQPDRTGRFGDRT